MAFDNPPLLMQAVTGDPALSYTAQSFRGVFDALVPVAGVTFKGDLAVTQRALGTNMSVDVPTGQAAVRGNVIAQQGTYLVRNTALINVPLATSSPTGDRWDVIVVQVYDKQADSGTQYAVNIAVVQGTPSAAAGTAGSFPATPADALSIAAVYVNAGITSIANSNIVDQRTLNTLGDVPLWELRGSAPAGTGQNIPSNNSTTYTGFTSSDLSGIGTNANLGEMVIKTPGRYVATYTHRITQGGTGAFDRQAYIEQVRNGAVIRRIGGQEFYGAIANVNTGVGQTASGIARCNVGDVLRGVSYQYSGVVCYIYDGYNEVAFTGARVGP